MKFQHTNKKEEANEQMRTKYRLKALQLLYRCNRSTHFDCTETYTQQNHELIQMQASRSERMNEQNKYSV